jgi:signal transduction histidine kinase
MEQLSSMNGCRYDLFMNSPATGIDNNVKLHCYRIIAELLHNIHKHAKATLASVQINIENDRMEIVVEDNGIGVYSNLSSQEGIGLMNIRNRINVCKGIMSIDSSEKGTTVIIEIPLNSIP